jgi:peptidoglycan hydrolase CwlO-like protein
MDKPTNTIKISKKKLGSEALLIWRNKVLISAGAVVLLSGLMVQPSRADNLSLKKQEKQQIQSEIDHNSNQVTKQKHNQQALQNKVNQTKASISGLTDQINANDNQTQQILNKITHINEQISQNQKQLNQDNADVQQMLRATYENGDVMYLSVLFNATSFSDLLSRVSAIATVTSAEKHLLDETESLHQKLQGEQRDQKAAYQELAVKGKQLFDLKQTKLSLQTQQQHSLTLVSRGLSALQANEQSLSKKLNMTNSQIKQMEEQTREQEAVLATGSGDVVVPSLRFQNISPTILYDYVHGRDSTFSPADIQTICSAAKAYDVNPALMVAITGQEQAFVPPGPDAALIRNNPFNVLFSWQVYNTNLADASNIAAKFLRFKLSTPPPNGEDAILWINDPRNPGGIYATDPNWAYGVRAFYQRIMSYVG